MNDKKKLIESSDYRVLARKYRPKCFSELIGQDTLVETLTNSIKLNRVAHAYLLTGVRGIGKTTTARLLARALNCENLEKNNFEPCNECEMCKSIVEERNMDIIEMDAASRTGVDDVREIIENVKYKPTSSKYKIYIIDEVHMLSKNAFNALLKTLEEPPPHIKFLFATTEVRKLPVTILSRCQRFDLFRVNNKIFTEFLFKIAKFENITISKDALALLVRAADGSVRDGLSLLDQAISNFKSDINEKNIIKMLGLTDRVKIYDLLDRIFEGDAVGALNLFKDLYLQGADIIMIFDEMIKITHFLTEVKILPSILEDPYIPEIEKTKGKEMSSQLSISSLGRFWQVLFKGYQELQFTSHLFQTSEMIIIRLIFLSNNPPPSQLIKEIEKEKKEFINNANEEKTIMNKSSDLVNRDKELLKKEKNDLENLKNIKITKINSFRELVELFNKFREGLFYTQLYNEVKLISFEEGKVLINCSRLKDKSFTRNITKLVSKWTGRIWNIADSDNSTGNTLAEEDIILKKLELEKFKKDNHIKKILETFPGSSIHSIEPIEKKENKEDINFKMLKKEKI